LTINRSPKTRPEKRPKGLLEEEDEEVVVVPEVEAEAEAVDEEGDFRRTALT